MHLLATGGQVVVVEATGVVVLLIKLIALVVAVQDILVG
jgi:sorbitol-specific phosphotransferase system component IIC